MNTDKKSKDGKLKKLILEKLAEHLGVEYVDISDEDYLLDDLHMEPSDLSEFLVSLEDNGINITDLDLKEIETVADLVEIVGLNQPM